MATLYTSVEQLVGHTPLLRLTRIEQLKQLNARILAKLELFNPAGSIKDRVALSMIRAAEDAGKLKAGATIIEPTSGNTGVGLACICAAKGYHAIIVMPDSMSVERRLLIKAYGAELVLTEGSKGMRGAIEKAELLASQIPNSMIAGQFVNPANPDAHRLSTGPEIWEDAGGDIDIFVAGVGTGGTITGVGEYLKSKRSDIRVVAVEPASSPLLSKGYAGSHGLQGIGANFVPEILNAHIYDEVIPVTEQEAYAAARLIGRSEGVLVGITSGAALHAAITLAARNENAGKTIVVLLPDTGERYLSTPLFYES